MASPRTNLIKLPPVFKGVDAFRHFEWTPQYGNKMLSQWVKQGVLDRLGPRLDVYAQTAWVKPEERVSAMLDALPVGHFRMDPNILRSYGWTTQISHVREELVPSLTRNCEPRLGLKLYARSRRWWTMMAPAYIETVKKDTTGYGPHIKPAWYLAEAMLNNTSQWWSPDPDDLDFDTMAMDIGLDELTVAFNTVNRYYHGCSLALDADCVETFYKQAFESIKAADPSLLLNSSEVNIR